MSFQSTMRAAARAAEQAAYETMGMYANAEVGHEPDITGVLVGQLRAALNNRQIGDLDWHATILKSGSGKSAQEAAVGADLLIHVQLNTPTQKYSKGVLVQAKRLERLEAMVAGEHKRLKKQCKDMLKVTAAAFVFDYAKTGMRCGSATRIRGSTNRVLYDVCEWTPYRFFYELFRCPIGDPRIRSHRFEDLQASHGIRIKGKGFLSSSD